MMPSGCQSGSKVLLAKYHLKDVQPGQFYPIMSYLGLLQGMEKKMPLVLNKDRWVH